VAAVTSLGEIFSSGVVRDLAGPRSYARGVAYLADGRVVPEAGGELRVRATVRGTVPYVVELWADDNGPGWTCTCPAAENGAFCKHCVAVASLYGEVPASEVGAEVIPTLDSERSGPDADLAGYVSGLAQARLVELVLAQVESDWRLRERLVAEAQAARGEGPDLDSWRRRVDAAFAPYDDFVDYREAAGWAREVDDVIDALDALCEAGHPDAAALLAEHAHRGADDAIQYVDDSDGWLTGISERLSELHQRACSEGAPEPVALARRLSDLELSSELDGFHRAAATYADVLGEAGRAEYRRLVEPRWLEVVARPDDWSTEHFRLREAMIGVALAGGDPDELIEVRRHDLRVPDDYLEIARTLNGAGRVDEAIEWARRGLDAFADRAWQTPPLRDFLSERLRERGDTAGAVALFWEAFEHAPALEAYRRLLAECRADEATQWRHRCIELLRCRIAVTGDDAAPQRPARRPAGSQVLVEILAHEGDVDAAWRAATDHGCDDRTWLALARAREKAHPLDAIGVYEREVFAQIDRKRNDAYRAAADLMARIQRLADTAGQPEWFRDVLTRVRSEHKAKRNLKALFDSRGW
jgi:uncharacterized Zn finger protein